MRVRFLQTTPSTCPDAPFQPGQVIEVPNSRTVRAWISEGYAELLPEPTLEAAAVAAPERAVPMRAKARTT